MAAASPAPSPAAADPAGPVVTSPSSSVGGHRRLVLQSSAFTDGGDLPSEYSCDGPGGGQSPPRIRTGAPVSSRAFAPSIRSRRWGGALRSRIGGLQHPSQHQTPRGGPAAWGRLEWGPAGSERPPRRRVSGGVPAQRQPAAPLSFQLGADSPPALPIGASIRSSSALTPRRGRPAQVGSPSSQLSASGLSDSGRRWPGARRPRLRRWRGAPGFVS